MISKRKAITLVTASLVAAASFSKSAVAQTPKEAQGPNALPAEIIALIDTVFKAFNNKDSDLLHSVYAGNVVVVDGFAPYRWTGPNALAEWWADTEKWAKEGGVEKEHLAYNGMPAWGLSGSRAYASISATLTITLKKGTSITRPGILAFTFAKLDEGWKAEGHAWGRLS
jgi:ketosteroid isomerase-like protein